MNRRVFPYLLAAAAVATPLVHAQTKAPEFEVVSIRPSADITGDHANVGMHIDGQMVRFTYFTLRDYIAMGYKLKQYQVQAPEWVTNEHFDIAAKLGDNVKRDQVPEMIQAMLADRFQLKFHRDSKEFPVYALLPGKNVAKLKESPLDAPEAGETAGSVNMTGQGGRNGVSLNLGRGASFTFANNHLEAKKVAMLSFADTLARFVDRPVVDMTGLKSTYDIVFDLQPEDYMGMLLRSAINAGVSLPPQARQMADEAQAPETLFSGLESIGLKLERRKAPLEVLVVDKIEKAPTAN